MRGERGGPHKSNLSHPECHEKEIREQRHATSFEKLNREEVGFCSKRSAPRGEGRISPAWGETRKKTKKAGWAYRTHESKCDQTKMGGERLKLFPTV